MKNELKNYLKNLQKSKNSVDTKPNIQGMGGQLFESSSSNYFLLKPYRVHSLIFYMSLSHNAQKQILKKFPHLELSYERKLHKKVQADIYLTIPKGKKYFAWFTNWNNKNMCFLLEINKKYNSIANISVNICSFDKMLCCGKVLHIQFFVNKINFLILKIFIILKEGI